MEEINNITEKAQTFIQEGLARSQQALTSVQEASEFVRAASAHANAAQVRVNIDRKSTRLNSSHIPLSRMPSSA